MLFNSYQYILFLPLVVLLYYLLPQRFRWILLLLASYYFYMSWEVTYALLILFTTGYNFFLSSWMHRQSVKHKRKIALLSVFIVNLGLLFFFKYFHFLTDSLAIIIEPFGLDFKSPTLKVLLPVGISFYTFQTLSYMIEVYYGRQEPEKHAGYFALYVVYFPQLVAGPIERYNRLTPQLKQHHLFSFENLKNGLRLILFGLFIKMLVADNLSVYVDQIFDSPQKYQPENLLTAIFFYSFQIYTDFYGYSIIAVGSALIMGVHLMDNFKTPYLSKSIGEFWKRWHISLSTWFRDYLFIPLGGSRVSYARLHINILIVFALSGLWHGANWTFVIWGVLHAIYYLLESIIGRIIKINSVDKWNVHAYLRLLLTFLLVSFAWIFFRAESIEAAFAYIKAVFVVDPNAVSLSSNPMNWLYLIVLIGFDLLLYKKRFDEWISQQKTLIRWFIYSLMLYGIIALSGVNNAPFIYFQF
jgi:alginate O-acetyltransferase complex protein AlgI